MARPGPPRRSLASPPLRFRWSSRSAGALRSWDKFVHRLSQEDEPRVIDREANGHEPRALEPDEPHQIGNEDENDSGTKPGHQPLEREEHEERTSLSGSREGEDRQQETEEGDDTVERHR